MSYRDFAQTVRTLIGFEPVRELFVSHVERWRRKQNVIADHIKRIDRAVAPLSQFEWPFKFTSWVLHGVGNGRRCKVPAELKAKYQRLENRPPLFPLSSDDRIRERTPSEQFTALAVIHDTYSERNDSRLGPSELDEAPTGERHYAFATFSLSFTADEKIRLREVLASVLARIEDQIDPITTNRDGEWLADVVVRIRKQWELQSSKSLATQARILAELAPAQTKQLDETRQEGVKVYLHGWGEILGVLTIDNNSMNQRRIRELSERFPGPIFFFGQGGQPKVVKGDLIVWHNGLEERFRNESSQREDAYAQADSDQAATVAGQYQHGKGGPDGQGTTVVPELGGHVRDRRATS